MPSKNANASDTVIGKTSPIDLPATNTFCAIDAIPVPPHFSHG